MSNQPTISFLPGNQFTELKEDYRKPHSLGYKNGYPIQKFQMLGIGLEPIEVNKELMNTSTELLLSSLTNDKTNRLTYGKEKDKSNNMRFVPAFVALDKVVLRFDAYFKETVHESTEQYHLRRMRILYFLEDDSISVVEPPVENSGIPQRNFIKRQRLPKEDTDQGFYTIRDFNLGINLTFYGRTFRLIGCDKFTENYMLETEHIKLNAPESMPDDPYVVLRNRPRRDFSVPSISPVIRNNDKLKKFLDFDRQVLRFYCVWDDRTSMFGELREFILHYYLVDDCVEVREVAKPNNGRDPFPILLRRQQLSKGPLEEGSNSERYTSKDLRIGNVINVLGRPFFIRDCDEYTKSYCQDNFGLTDLQVTPIQFDMEDNVIYGADQETAPYNGFGTIEDSLGSCKYLVLKPPKKDFIKMLENEHKILRFVAKMESQHKEDKDRRFVISYRLADDMMTIYEPPQRNAGVLGGKFMERTRVLKPSTDGPTLSSVSALGSTKTPAYYNADDLYIGARLDIFRHKFFLIDADEYVFKYMEDRPFEFPLSDRAKVVKAFKTIEGDKVVLKALEAKDREKTGVLDRKVFVEAVKGVVGEKITEHELITLSRPYEDKYRRVEYKKVLGTL